MFKQMDQNDNMTRLKRAQSAYKESLVGKLINKGQRAYRQTDLVGEMSRLAYLNNMSFRKQLDSAT